MSRVGSEICRLRKEAGLTQKQLAKSTGVSEGFIEEVESGRRIINSDLIARFAKALRQEAGKLDLFNEDEIRQRPEPERNVKRVIEKPVQKIWTDALAGVIMNVPVYDLKMDKAVGSKSLPIVSNKVDGFPKDRVFYLTAADNEMTGFRIAKGDLVFSCRTQELEKEGIYLIEYGGKRCVRQVKKLNQDKLLLIGNDGSLSTVTAPAKEVNILAALIRLEIML
jgi:transcriptional regulator with XRE-family HTH domain